MSEHAHQFASIEQQNETTHLGMWVFLCTEVLLFGGLFAAYLIFRLLYPHVFAEASHHMDIVLGGINTAALLTSSLTMVLAVDAAHRQLRNQTLGYLFITMFFGVLFLVIKGFEYHHKYVDHHIPGPHFHYEGLDSGPAQLFFLLYFMMTGLHAAHMVIGLALMAWMVLFVIKASKKPSAHFHHPVHLAGLYWHFVDVVWVFLFPLLYLIGTR